MIGDKQLETLELIMEYRFAKIVFLIGARRFARSFCNIGAATKAAIRTEIKIAFIMNAILLQVDAPPNGKFRNLCSAAMHQKCANRYAQRQRQQARPQM